MPPSPESHAQSKPAIAGRSRRAVVMFLAIAAFMFVVDLAVKHYAFLHVAGQPVIDRHHLPPHDPVTLIPSVLSLKLTWNHGAVFGMGQGGRTVFIGVTLLAIVVIITMFWRSSSTQRALHIGLALILSGAMGNLYDRLFHGAVRDMLYLFPGVQLPFGWSWPGGIREVYPWIFNVADVSLVIGVGTLMITLLRKPTTPLTEQNNR